MGVQSKPAIGVNGKIVIGNEVTPGTPAARNLLDRKICFTTESLAMTESELESATICGCSTGSSRGRTRGARGSLDVAGDIQTELSPQEYGRLIRHSMGEVVVLKNGVAEARARVLRGYDSAGAATSVEFAQYAQFANSGAFGVVYRDASGALVADDNGGAGWAFSASSDYLLTQVVSSTVAGPDVAAGDTIQLAYGPDEQAFNGPSGVFTLEVAGVRYVIGYSAVNVSNPGYFEVTVSSVETGLLAPGGTIIPGTLSSIPVGGVAYQIPSMTTVAGVTPGLTYGGTSDIPSGVWFYELWDEALADPNKEVYLHHYEIGNELPPGLTINILRDTVGFIYTGMKVNEWTVTFDSQAYVTSTWAFMGVAEFSVVELAREAKVGDTSIYVNKEPITFNTNGGTLTIGDEMKITYATVTKDPAPNSDLWILGGIPASGVESIQRPHRIGENVDSSSLASTVDIDCEDSPRYTSMDAVVTMDYKLIEVLNGNLTLNNNIDGSKYMLGSRFRAALREARAAVTGSITVEFDDGQHYKRFVEGELFDVEFRVICEDRDFTGRFGVEAPIATVFYCAQCKYSGTTPSIQDESYLNTDMPFDAYDDNRLGIGTPALVVSVTNYDQLESA